MSNSSVRSGRHVGAVRLLFVLAAALWLSACATGNPVRSGHGELQKFTVLVEGHPFALWSRQAVKSKGSILLLHGRTWSALPDFDLNVPGDQRSVMVALNERGYTTYALDMRGYGATARDATGWLTPQRAAADLAGVLRWIAAREQQPPTLLGWSYGSLIAQLALQQHPSLAPNLVLFGYPFDPAQSIPAGESPAAPLREGNTRERAASDFISPRVTPPAVVEAYVQAALAADPIRVDWRETDQFKALDASKMTVPTLLMHGERDPLAPLAAQARLFTTLGTADKQWVVLAGGDHAALIEDTLPAFIAAIVAFIERPRIDEKAAADEG